MFNWWRTTQCWRGSVLNSSVPSLPPQAVHTALDLHRLAHCSYTARTTAGSINPVIGIVSHDMWSQNQLRFLCEILTWEIGILMWQSFLDMTELLHFIKHVIRQPMISTSQKHLIFHTCSTCWTFPPTKLVAAGILWLERYAARSSPWIDKAFWRKCTPIDYQCSVTGGGWFYGGILPLSTPIVSATVRIPKAINKELSCSFPRLCVCSVLICGGQRQSCGEICFLSWRKPAAQLLPTW